MLGPRRESDRSFCVLGRYRSTYSNVRLQFGGCNANSFKLAVRHPNAKAGSSQPRDGSSMLRATPKSQTGGISASAEAIESVDSLLETCPKSRRTWTTTTVPL